MFYVSCSRGAWQDERDFGPKINNAVFPALQGGPHEHQIAGVATQLLESMTPEFKEYIVQVREYTYGRCAFTVFFSCDADGTVRTGCKFSRAFICARDLLLTLLVLAA